MNIGISNHYTEQVSIPSINSAEIHFVEKSKKKWTDAENAQLSNYIKEFGENWKRIAEKIPGKTHQQCKNHWIRVLNPTIKHGKWTEEEDEQLKNLVDQHGKKWAEIAKEMSGRTSLQCYQHYKRTLNPAIKKRKWTEEEDEQLKNLVDQHGEKWAEIAEEMSGRTNMQCSQHYKTLNAANKQGKWTEEEDEQLKNLVDQYGEKWAKIAKEMSGRTERQCIYHYQTLNAANKQERWTEEEDEQLKNLVDQYGEKWAKITKEMSGRTERQCIYHYKTFLNPAVKQGKWTEEEEEQLKNLVDQYGEKWAKIAKEISGRTDLQCSQHYNSTLNPTIKRGKWTEEEDEQLKNLVDQHGEKWIKIAKEMRSRTNNQCLVRYRKTLNRSSKQEKWTKKEDNQLKEAVQRIGEGQWALIAQEARSETNSSVEERPLKKFKKNHSPQLLDLDENEIPLDRQPIRLDQPQLILFNQSIPQYLEEPLDAIVLTSIVQQSLNYQEEPFIAEHDLFLTEQERTSAHVEQQMVSNKINDFIIQKNSMNSLSTVKHYSANFV